MYGKEIKFSLVCRNIRQSSGKYQPEGNPQDACLSENPRVTALSPRSCGENRLFFDFSCKLFGSVENYFKHTHTHTHTHNLRYINIYARA
jgi:hypothetical protein